MHPAVIILVSRVNIDDTESGRDLRLEYYAA